MSYFKEERIRDEPYKAHIRTLECMVPGCSSFTCDAAHIRTGQTGGMGLTPSDDLINPLCREHHREQTDWPKGEADWWMERVTKPMTRLRYHTWKNKY